MSVQLLYTAIYQDGIVIEDLYEDLKDGINLIRLLEFLSKKPIVSSTEVS